MKQTIITFSFLFLIFSSKGQVLRRPDLYYASGITKVERKDRTGKNYRTLYELDSTGRTIEIKSLKKESLLFRTCFTYNSNNDATSIVSNYDIGTPNKSDTLQYYYEYNNGEIILQKEVSQKGDSTVYKMIENKGDSIFTYKVSRYGYQFDRKINRQADYTLILTYYNNLLTKEETIGKDSSKAVRIYEYYENGDLKRRVMKLFSTSIFKPMLMGAPGADDQTYKYSYDKKGRIRDHYTIRNNKKYKSATYRYK